MYQMKPVYNEVVHGNKNMENCPHLEVVAYKSDTIHLPNLIGIVSGHYTSSSSAYIISTHNVSEDNVDWHVDHSSNESQLIRKAIQMLDEVKRKMRIGV